MLTVFNLLFALLFFDVSLIFDSVGSNLERIDLDLNEREKLSGLLFIW